MVFFGVNVAIIWSPQCRCRRESFYICISLLLISVPPPVARSYNFEPRSHRCLSLPIFVSCASNSAQLLDCLNIDCAEWCIRFVLVTNHPRGDQSTCCMTLGSDEGWSLERRSAGPSQRRVRSCAPPSPSNHLSNYLCKHPNRLGLQHSSFCHFAPILPSSAA